MRRGPILLATAGIAFGLVVEWSSFDDAPSHALAENGLMPALRVLAERSPAPVELSGEVPRLPRSIETALFFVCSEALANAAKHAAAARLTIDVEATPDRVRLVVADDGRGGVDPTRGTGLRGLADRVQALGGQVTVESPPGGGTRLAAEIPTERE